MLLPSRTHRFVRCSRWLLLIAGIFALAYVGLTLLDARLFQVSAKHILKTQIKMVKNAKIGESRPIVQEGDILGRINIPRLGVSVPDLQGTGSRVLRLGAGLIEGTPLPGDAGNSGIAGHRDTFFRELRDIRKDDEIQLQTPTALLHYVVDWVKVVEPDDTTVPVASLKTTIRVSPTHARLHGQKEPSEPGAF
jgi:LPXTG-site transpeptidase (sortase) family protein